MQKFTDNDIQIEQNSEKKFAIAEFFEKFFKGKPYYSDVTNTKTKSLKNKFAKMDKLANKLVGQHILQEMVKSSMTNPNDGFKLKQNDYAHEFFAKTTDTKEYYQSTFDKILYTIKQYFRQTATILAVYSTLFVTLYNTTQK